MMVFLIILGIIAWMEIGIISFRLANGVLQVPKYEENFVLATAVITGPIFILSILVVALVLFLAPIIRKMAGL